MRVTRSRIVPIILGALLALPALLAAQEPVTITGTVKSDAGQPLGQVQVSIPSLGLGALTKDDGRYTVLVPGVRVTGQAVALVARRGWDTSRKARRSRSLRAPRRTTSPSPRTRCSSAKS